MPTPKDNQAQALANAADNDGLPEQTAPSEYDLIDQCVDRRLRERFEAIGLTSALASRLGLDLTALDVIDTD